MRQERTEWHSVVVWGKRAEALGKFLTKGSGLFIEGGLRTSSYDDRDGNKRYRTEVVANNVILAGSGGGRGGGRCGGGGGGGARRWRWRSGAPQEGGSGSGRRRPPAAVTTTLSTGAERRRYPVLKLGETVGSKDRLVGGFTAARFSAGNRRLIAALVCRCLSLS